MIMSRRILCRLAGIVAALLAWGSPQTPAQAQGGDVLIFAAASLKNALDAINAQWQKETGKNARISSASSAALAKQIEQGAPAQIFISADLDWMDYLAASRGSGWPRFWVTDAWQWPISMLSRPASTVRPR